MSYQSPYQPPTGYSTFDYAHPDLLAPARRASIMMFVVGGLTLLGSFCCIGVGAMMPQLVQQQPEFAAQMQSVPGATPKILRMVFVVLGGLVLIAGLLLFVLGVFVRRGGKGAIITSMVLTILSVLFLLLNIVSSIFQISGPNGHNVLLGMCMMTLPLVLLVILIVMLVGALKASDQVAAHRYSVQYWQHAQQQAYAQQPGYGYAPPPPPQQQSTLPPPPPPPASGDSNGPPAQG